jgi:hypothetical protein
MFKRRPQVYKYFICFQVIYSKVAESWLDTTEVHLDSKIKSIQQIWKIEEFIKNATKHKDDLEVRVTNFKLLDKSKDYVLTNLDWE